MRSRAFPGYASPASSVTVVSVAFVFAAALLLSLVWLPHDVSSLIPLARASSGSVTYPLGYSADLSIAAAGPTGADRGAVFTETFTVTDLGPSVAHNVVVTELIPQGLLFQPIGSSSLCTADAVRITCSLGTIATNQPQAVSVAFLTRPQDMCYTNTYQTSATVQASENDNNQANNTSNAVSTAIRCPPNLAQCADGIDNDSDGLIDKADPGCHTDFNPSNAGSYDPTIPSESREVLGNIEAQDRLRQQMRIQSRLPGFHLVVLPDSASSSSLPPQQPAPLPPPVPSAPMPTVPSTAALSLRLQESQSEAQAGDSITYAIIVRNISTQLVQGVQVVFRYPVSQLQVTSAPVAQQSDGQAQWMLTLAPNQVQVLRIGARVNPSVAQGTQVTATASVTGMNIVRGAAVLSVLNRLPKTGAEFTGPLENTASLLSPVSAGGSVSLLFIALAAVAATAGTIVSRRFLR